MLGEVVKKLRKKRKMSQGDLCEKVDVTQPYLSMIENNKADPALSRLKKIAIALDVPLSILFWFTLSEDEIHHDKKEVYKILKPAVDEFITSVFSEDIV